jgi:threonylcarbamoyladenosine tRNA methylthiotransferase MtaB
MQIAFTTLGCNLNYAETSTYERGFKAAGWEVVPWTKQADVYLINTCAVTETAEKKSRNLIRRAHKTAPEARIVVTGCYAELRKEQLLEIEGVWRVFGATEKGQILGLADAETAETPVFGAYSTGERTRSFLKVQDGCDNFCAYCTVPYARGRSRNLSICECVKMARNIAAEGVKEVVLTGVNTGDFGRTTGETFLDLLKALNEVEGIERYRISSIEPNLLTREILEWMASAPTKFLPHFHIPLQSGCDRTLKAMHRRYTAQMFEDKIALVRELLERPEERGSRVFFGIDVIVGFPGESEEDFETTYRLLERVKPAFLHIFPYSRRPGTPAAERADQVQESVKTERVARLEQLSDRLHAAFCLANKGREAEVLFESANKGGMMFGYTDNYIRIEREYDPAQIGRIVKVTV